MQRLKIGKIKKNEIKKQQQLWKSILSKVSEEEKEFLKNVSNR